MGRRVSKSGQIAKAQSLASCALERQESINDTITSLETLASDDSLSGEAYTNVKGYMSSVLIPINKALGMALNDEAAANKKVIDCCNAYLDGVDFLDEDSLNDEIRRLESENDDLQNDWGWHFPLVIQINSMRIMYNELKISILNKEREKLKTYDNATEDVHGVADLQMDMVVQKINSIFSKPLFVNGRYDYSGVDMKWSNGLVKRWDDYKTGADSNFKTFTLPQEQKDEVERIINSDLSWEEKAEQIRRVYESYLFENVKDENGNNPFLDYASKLHEYGGDTSADRMVKPEKQLGLILQNSGVDIRSVTRALSEDLLRAMPQEVDIVNKTLNFINLVKTGAPADLKSNELNDSVSVDNSENYSFNFSIWSRKWESTMEPDYLGNYSFGYIGADYWQGADFDDVVESGALIKSSLPSGTGKNFVDALTVYTTGMSAVSALRVANPDKTDAEMFCLIGAGGAQLYGDVSSKINSAIENRNLNDLKKIPKEFGEYFESIGKGNWGDNAGDSEMISDGFNDYYGAHGIDKSQIIKEERKIK